MKNLCCVNRNHEICFNAFLAYFFDSVSVRYMALSQMNPTLIRNVLWPLRVLWSCHTFTQLVVSRSSILSFISLMQSSSLTFSVSQSKSTSIMLVVLHKKISGFISRECSLTQLIEFEYFNIAVYLFAKVRTVLSEAFPSSSVCNNSYRARKKHYIYLCEEDTWLMWG